MEHVRLPDGWHRSELGPDGSINHFNARGRAIGWCSPAASQYRAHLAAAGLALPTRAVAPAARAAPPVVSAPPPPPPRVDRSEDDLHSLLRSVDDDAPDLTDLFKRLEAEERESPGPAPRRESLEERAGDDACAAFMRDVDLEVTR